MDFKNIVKLLSMIGMTLSIFFSLDVIVGVLYGEFYHEMLIFNTVFFGINAAIWIVLRKHLIRFSIKESILSVNILWLLIGAAGAMPLYLYTPVTFSSYNFV